MEQEQLFIDDWREAVRAIAHRLGRRGVSGAKVLGAMLRPDLDDPEQAGRWLCDCLNTERERFELKVDQFLLIVKVGRELGVHVLMHHVCERTGYTIPAPISPEDQRAEIEKNVGAKVDELRDLLDRYESLKASTTTQLRSA